MVDQTIAVHQNLKMLVPQVTSQYFGDFLYYCPEQII